MLGVLRYSAKITWFFDNNKWNCLSLQNSIETDAEKKIIISMHKIIYSSFLFIKSLCLSDNKKFRTEKKKTNKIIQKKVNKN